MHLKTGNFFFKKKKSWGKQRSFIPRLLLLKSLNDTHWRKYLLLFKRQKKAMSFLWTQFYFWMLKMFAFFKAILWKGKAMKWFRWPRKVKYGSWTIQSTSWEVTRFAFRAYFFLSKTPLSPPIWVGVLSMPTSVCSQVSPQVFRLGGECFGRWWWEVVLKVGEMGVKRWILNWTDGKALDPC